MMTLNVGNGSRCDSWNMGSLDIELMGWQGTAVEARGWQASVKSPVERLRYIYHTGVYSDVQIMLPGCSVPVEAHRLVLAVSSPVFASMLLGPLAEKRETLDLPEDDADAFRKLLCHAYTGAVDLVSVDSALCVYTLAHKYDMDALMADCSGFLLDNLTTECVLAVYDLATLLEDNSLQDACMKLLQEDPDSVMSSSSVACMRPETLKHLFARPDLTVSSEIILFQALVTWGKAQLPREKAEEDAGLLRDVIDHILTEIRLLSLGLEEFTDVVLPTEVFTPEEVVSIIRAIRGNMPPLDSISDLPCSPLTEKRLKCRYQPDNLLIGSVLCGGLQNIKISYDFRKAQPLLENVVASHDLLLRHVRIGHSGVLNVFNENEICVASVACSSDKCFVFSSPLLLPKGRKYSFTFYTRGKIASSLLNKTQTLRAANSSVEISLDVVYAIDIYFFYWKK
ncbi:BTB/POZ domain-containing protein 6-A-like [Oratosquilla oratoria]|uniref:BTB/POZ domain-containing protein 6-A-like n=1 Tax=Oratosquilla oratoria TaxID=337810 RepID=UPI003F76733C